MGKKNHLNLNLITLTFLLTLSLSLSLSQHPDFTPLMAFKSSSDPNNTLSSWTPNNNNNNPCSNWYGVTCINNRVSHLVLEGLGLRGPLHPLTALSDLRVLSLKRNRLSGPLPTNLSALSSLKLLFLTHNSLSGYLPPSLPAHLYRLDLAHNSLSGDLPVAALNRLPHLLTLCLESNRLSGQISPLNLPNLQDFNVSGNRLNGQIPKSLSGFPVSAFDGNESTLCGSPLPICKLIVSNPSPNPAQISNGTEPVSIISSSPTSNPASPAAPPSSGKKMSAAAILGIVVADVVVLGLVSSLVFCYFWKHLAGKSTVEKTVGRQLVESEKIVYSMRNESGFERGKMVFFEEGRRFELEDLLRASAEMLGKGGFGTAYKAVLDDGNVVAVKRLKEVNVNGGGGKREFEQVMETLGRLRHPNVVSLKAYYFARDERLLVFDYMPNGSLFWLLHGNRGPGRTPLDWTTRMKIASGVAHGLAYIHHYCINRTTNKLWHGNIKSTNVLLDKVFNPRLSDWGLGTLFASSLTTTTNTAAKPPNGYRAPEALEGRKYSHQKADVYAFGVLLLEILTGKCPLVVDSNGVSSGGAVLDLPRWVQSVVREEWTAEVFDLELMRYKDIEEEMVGLLQIAMACTCVSPDQRPRIGSVLRMIEEIRGVEVSPSYESFDSDSPSVSECTDG